MQPTIPKTPITSRSEWHEQYFFTPFQQITVINPRSEDYNFTVEGRHFMVGAGSSQTFTGTIANVYLDMMTRILAQEDDKMEYLSDFNLMAAYFDKLIVDKIDLERQAEVVPQYLREVRESAATEQAPWQLLPPKPPVAPEPPKVQEAEEEVKEFEQGGSQYKSLKRKDGRLMFYKDNKLTSEAEFAKAVSML
jgi:hypothetical protein